MSLPSLDPVSNWISTAKIIALLVVFAILFGIIGYLAYTKSRVETQLAQAQTDITALTAANENWKTTTDQANAALSAANAAELQREQIATAAVAAAQKQSDEYTKEADTIMASKVPTGPAPVGTDPQCDAAKKMVSSFFGSHK